MDQEAIVEAVTREVLSALTGEAWDHYLACIGDCAAHSSDKVRDVVAAGASRISYNGSGADVPTDLAGYIDHTLLKADASAAEIDRMCDEAIRVRLRLGVRQPRPGSSGSPTTCAAPTCSPAR